MTTEILTTTTPAAPVLLPDPAACAAALERARVALDTAHRIAHAELRKVTTIEDEREQLAGVSSKPIFGEPEHYALHRRARSALAAASNVHHALAAAQRALIDHQAHTEAIARQLDHAAGVPETPVAHLDRLGELKRQLAGMRHATVELVDLVERVAPFESSYHRAAQLRRAAVVEELHARILADATSGLEGVRRRLAEVQSLTAAAEEGLRALVEDSAAEFGPLDVGRVVWNNTGTLERVSVSREERAAGS